MSPFSRMRDYEHSSLPLVNEPFSNTGLNSCARQCVDNDPKVKLFIFVELNNMFILLFCSPYHTQVGKTYLCIY